VAKKMSFCKHCTQGVTYEGTPKGKWEKIGGVDCYVGTPTIEYPKDKAILYLADIFGPQFINAQLLVDDFTANGFKTFAVDYLNSDPVPADTLLGPGGNFDLAAWFTTHGPAQTRPPLNKVITALKEQGVTAFAAVGYCFGGRYAFDLAFDNVIKVAAVAHPSLLKVPEDIEKYLATSEAPLLINSCTYDPQFPPESQTKTDGILGEGKFKPGYKREYFEGCTHGFAVRGDISKPEIKAGKEGAFKATVEWFIARL